MSDPVDASHLGAALIASLSERDLSALAGRLAPYLPEVIPPIPSIAADGWLDSAGAAAHLAMSRHAIHKLTAAREIPFEQDGAGCKLWFRRADLDRWREGGGRRSRGRPSGAVAASTVLPEARHRAC